MGDGGEQVNDSASAASLGGETLVVAVTDARRTMAYLLAPESDDYLAVMSVLESSITDLSPAEVTARLRDAGMPLEQNVVETRLEKLHSWGAASPRSDTSQVHRYTDLLARNWRYSATPVGRQVHRFYLQHLAGTPTMREIPLASLASVVAALEALADLVTDPSGPLDAEAAARSVNLLFTSHDDLDAALVGAEDNLANLADRFDLDSDRTGHLKSLLVDYATHVATELELGSARAFTALRTLRPAVHDLVAAAVASSDAAALIQAGTLTASRGGRVDDWEDLTAWFDSMTGRAARFSLRLVRALPGMHANIRRLHTSTGTATTRARALLLASAAADPVLGTQIWQAAVGDHSWRKLSGEVEDEETVRPGTSWRDAPGVTVPALLRATGRTGARGRAAAARDDTAARAVVAARRAERERRHWEALAEVLAAAPGQRLSDHAARVALAAVNAAARGTVARRRPTLPEGFSGRRGHRDGLACTLLYVGPGITGLVVAPMWRALLPGRIALFHRPNQPASLPESVRAALDARRADGRAELVDNGRVDVRIEGVA